MSDSGTAVVNSKFALQGYPHMSLLGYFPQGSGTYPQASGRHRYRGVDRGVECVRGLAHDGDVRCEQINKRSRNGRRGRGLSRCGRSSGCLAK